MSDASQPVDLFSQQAANRRRSRWLVVTFVLFFAWLGLGGDWLAWQFTRSAPPDAYHHAFPFFGLAMFALGFGLVSYIRKTGADKVLWSTGARQLLEPATPEQKTLDNVVQEMAIAAGLPKPTIWIVDDPDPNAFTTGNDPEHAHVAVTTGLLATLNRDELQAVIGHEMGHVKNLDTQLMTMIAGLVGALALISNGTGRVLFSGARIGGRGGSGRSSKNLGPVVIVVLVVWLVSWMLAPIITRMMALGISRGREYLADSMSAQFTRNPAALATALEKIEHADSPTTSIKGGVAHLCIADPLGRRMSSVEGFLGDLLATHPPMALRVSRLRAMGYQTQKAAGNLPPPGESS
ncbi:MAG: M48 family metalloprotease [Gemmatimonadales bacterium]